MLVAFSQQLFSYGISFMWISFVAAVVTYVSGLGTSYLASPSPAPPACGVEEYSL